MHPKSRQLVFHRIVERRARETPDAPLLVDEHRRLNYADVDRLANELGNGLLASGIERGEPVLTMLPTSLDYILVWLALCRIGAIMVPINDSYRGSVLRHQIELSQARSMIVEGQYLDQVLGLQAAPGRLSRLILRNGDDGHRRACEAHYSLLDFGALHSGNVADCDVGTEYFDPMSVFFTSGTTGPSKGVLCSHAQGHATALPMGREMTPSDVFFLFSPLYHVALPHIFGAVVIAGASLALRPKFSASRFLDHVREFGATVTMLLGGSAQFLMNQPESDRDRDHTLRKVLMVPLLRDLDRFRARFNCEVMTWFNMTEVSTPLHSDGFKLKNVSSCGRPREGVQARIVDEFDEPVPPGTIGELVIRTSNPWELSLGYWRDPEATVQAWRNQWFHTGDLMMMDGDGDFYFVDRLKDAIRRRGENISSLEVEREINAHPAVAESAVVGVPATEGEEEVLAIIVLKPGEDAEPMEIARFLEARMAPFMIPRFIRFHSGELEKTTTGKIQKSALRAMTVEDCWDRLQSESARGRTGANPASMHTDSPTGRS